MVYTIEQNKTVGTLLFGRITYEGIASYWAHKKGTAADFMNSVPKVVFSRTLKRAEWSNTRLVRSPPEVEVARLKAESGKDLFILGSGNLIAYLTERRLIDEYRLRRGACRLGQRTPSISHRGQPDPSETSRFPTPGLRSRNTPLRAGQNQSVNPLGRRTGRD